MEKLHCRQPLPGALSVILEPWCLYCAKSTDLFGTVICTYHIQAEGGCTSFHIEWRCKALAFNARS